MNIPMIKAEGCKNCKHRIEENGQLFCAFYPPTAAAIITPPARGNEAAGPGIGWVSSFPPVPPDLKCGQYVHGILKAEMN